MSNSRCFRVRRAVLVVLGLVLASCSNAQPNEASVPVTQIERAESGLTEAPRALITPSGVVVPVLSATGSSYVVGTPCGDEESLVWGQPLRDIQVVLDPGHGGSEEGAVSGSATEASVNFEVAQLTASLLNAKGFSVVLTRTRDYRVPITSRVAIIEALRPNLYVSIHHNSAPVEPSNDPGAEVYIQTDSPESERLGGLIYENVFQALQQFDDVSWVSASNAGVLSVVNDDGEDAYGIVRGPVVPGVLAELAYISNPSEAELITTEEYQLAVSEAMVEAIVNFLMEPSARGAEYTGEQRDFPVDNSTGGTDDCEDPELR